VSVRFGGNSRELRVVLVRLLYVGNVLQQTNELANVSATNTNQRSLNLALLARRRDLGAENDVADFGLSERLDVHVVLLAVVSQNQILKHTRREESAHAVPDSLLIHPGSLRETYLERHLGLDPLILVERGPDIVRLRDDGLPSEQQKSVSVSNQAEVRD
jgi:hypothetical protein